MNLSELDRRLVAVGSDLERQDRYSLINEGMVRLAVEAEWTRRSVVLTGGSDGVYELPPDCARVLSVSVAGVSYMGCDPGDARSGNVWWYGYGPDGEELLHLFPVPGPDVPVQVTMVFRPVPLLVETDEPPLPVEFHGEIPNSALAFAYGMSEDDPELMELYRDRHERAVRRLRAFRVRRRNNGPRQVRIVGWR